MMENTRPQNVICLTHEQDKSSAEISKVLSNMLTRERGAVNSQQNDKAGRRIIDLCEM